MWSDNTYFCKGKGHRRRKQGQSIEFESGGRVAQSDVDLLNSLTIMQTTPLWSYLETWMKLTVFFKIYPVVGPAETLVEKAV